MRRVLAPIALVLAPLACVWLVSCGVDVRAGYFGTIPCSAAQESLHALVGRPFPAAAVGASGPDLALEDFVVASPERADEGPFVLLRESGRGPDAPPSARRRIPVLTDGDAADLVRRITGSAPASFGGGTSPAYRAAVTPGPR